MRGTTWIAVLVLSTAAVACGGGGGGGGDLGRAQFQQALQGAWSSGCAESSSGEGRRTERMELDGAQGLLTLAWYGPADETCTGEHRSSEIPFTLTFGGEAAVHLGDRVVTAREVDDTTEDGTTYTILYVDTASTPHRLYGGDLDADPARDGTSPARRPTALSPEFLERE